MSTVSLVVVKWSDAREFSSSYGYTLEECLEFKLAMNETIGYLLEETEDVVRLASERRGGGERFSDVNIIPTSQVTSIKKIRIRESK